MRAQTKSLTRTMGSEQRLECDPRTGLEYSLRVSSRAKYARLSVSAEEGVTIVLPRRFPRAQVSELIDERWEWIQKAEERVAPDREFLEAQRAATRRPDRISLAALGREWTVEYLRSADARVRTREFSSYLRVCGSISSDEAVAESLQRWLGRIAHAAFVPWLFELSDQHGLAITSVTVRRQRTRWASCSASGSISLNRNLLFLPEDLVKFVLLHELCHRMEMSHSARFWRLLQQAEPRTAQFNEELKSAWRLVPYWAQI